MGTGSGDQGSGCGRGEWTGSGPGLRWASKGSLMGGVLGVELTPRVLA